MKKIIIMLLSFTIIMTANAQKGGGRIIAHRSPHVIVINRFVPSYGLGLGYGFGSPWGYGYNPYRNSYHNVSPRLEAKETAIKSEYRYKIKTVRKDKALSGTDRRDEIRGLKVERNNALSDAIENYYRNRK